MISQIVAEEKEGYRSQTAINEIGYINSFIRQEKAGKTYCHRKDSQNEATPLEMPGDEKQHVE